MNQQRRIALFGGESIPAPETPSFSLTAGDATILLGISPVENATGYRYRLQRARPASSTTSFTQAQPPVDIGDTLTEIITVFNPAFGNPNIQNNRVHRVSVQAYRGGKSSPWSAWQTVTPVETPSN